MSTSNPTFDGNVTLDVPRDLDTSATLEHCGLTPEAAVRVYNAWTEAQAISDLESLIKFTCESVYEHNLGITISSPDLDHASVLHQLGANDDLIARILDPDFTNVFLTQEPVYWLIDTIEVRFMSLEEGEDQPNIRSSPSTSESSSNSLLPPVSARPGETILWKGIARRRVRSFLGSSRFLSADLRSGPHGDFNASKEVLYFTPSVEGSMMYAGYVKRRAGNGGACLLRLALPNEVLDYAKPCSLRFPSDEFKQTVWMSRRGESLCGVLDGVHGAQLLVGDTCKAAEESITRLEGWASVDERNLLRLSDGSRMTQYMFDVDWFDRIPDIGYRLTVHTAEDGAF